MRVLAVFTLAVVLTKTMGCGDVTPSASNAPKKTPVTVTEANFAAIVKTSQPVVIDCWAAWCGPCKALGPIVEEVAYEFDGRAVVAKLDIDDNTAVASAFGIQSIPTLLFFQDGQLVDRMIGVQSRERISAKLSGMLAAAKENGAEKEEVSVDEKEIFTDPPAPLPPEL